MIGGCSCREGGWMETEEEDEGMVVSVLVGQI